MKSKIGIKDIIIIILLIIIGGGVFIVLNSKSDSKCATSDDVAETKKEDDPYYKKEMETFKDVIKDDDIVGKKVTDTSVIKELKTKTNLIVSGGQKNTADDVISYTHLPSWVDFTNLDSDSKMTIVLYKNINSLKEITDEIYTSKVKPEYDVTKEAILERDSGGNIDELISTYIEFSDVEDDYKYLFGNDYKKEIKEVYSCPVFHYLKTTDVYVANYGCGGTGYPLIYTYIHNITEDGDKGYIYLSALTTTYDGTILSGIPTPKSDGYTDELVELLTADENIDYSKLLMSNYKKFDNYKLEFKKDSNGNYLFVDAKLIAEQDGK